jgi:hypothetical protein
MLQRVQAEVGEGLGLRVRVDCDDAAFVTKFVGNNHSALSRQKKAALGFPCELHSALSIRRNRR